jgi:hypothetical protein
MIEPLRSKLFPFASAHSLQYPEYDKYNDRGDIAQKKEDLDKIYMKVWTHNME